MVHAFQKLRLTNHMVMVTGASNKLRVDTNYVPFESDLVDVSGVLNARINAIDVDETKIVWLTGNQTIDGVKTFNDNLILTTISDVSATNVINFGNGNIAGTWYYGTYELANKNDVFLTGTSLQNQINNFNTTYASQTNLFNTGSTLNTKINNTSGVLDGKISATGTSLQNQINNLGNTYSSKTDLYNTGSILDTKINNTSGVLDGKIAATGTSLQNQINNLGNTYATKTDLYNTGSTLNNRLNTASGLLSDRIEATGIALKAIIDTLPVLDEESGIYQITVANAEWAANAVTANTANNALALDQHSASYFATADNLTQTGITLLNAMGGSYASKTDLYNTGSTLDTKINNTSGVLNSSIVATGNNLQIQISNLGNTYATKANLELTGSNLQTQINNLGNTYATKANLETTGSTLNTNLVNASGALNTSIGLVNTSFNNYADGRQEFSTAIPVGVDSYAISFTDTFGSIPKVQTTLEVAGDILYSVCIKSRTVNGYTALFSDVIQEEGVVLHTFASIG